MNNEEEGHELAIRAQGDFLFEHVIQPSVVPLSPADI